jgi:hypothetical protein
MFASKLLDWSASVSLAACDRENQRQQAGRLRSSQASARAASGLTSGRFLPPIHLRTESITTITAAVMIKAVKDVLM